MGKCIVVSIKSPIPGIKAYMIGECTVLVGVENGLYHLSVSHPARYPTWDEIKDARYSLVVPHNITMVMYLPPEEQYVNFHPNCFHLWEVRETTELPNMLTQRHNRLRRL